MAETTNEPKNSPLALASLVIGLVSLFGVLPLFGGVIAIILGYLAKSEIDSSQGDLKGANLATIGQVAGAVHIVGAFVIACCVVAYLVASPFLLRTGGRLY